MHDPCAARIAVAPDLARYLEAPAGVELRSPATRGMLLVDQRAFAPPPEEGGPPIRIATEVDARAVVEGVVSRLVAPP
jgi:inosine-uridine nucleoside N-ribohydrolase